MIVALLGANPYGTWTMVMRHSTGLKIRNVVLMPKAPLTETWAEDGERRFLQAGGYGFKVKPCKAGEKGDAKRLRTHLVAG